LSRRHRYAM